MSDPNSPSYQTLLLKTQSYPTDPYDTLFSAHGFSPIFVPVMQHRHLNLESLKSLILEKKIWGLPSAERSEDEPAEDCPGYGAIIITSQRAVEALGAVLTSLKETHPTFAPQTSSVIVYIVGPATAKAVQALGFPASSIHGAHCGTGDVLSDFIPGHYRSIASGRITSKKFLFLVGEIRRDIIPKKLGAAGFSVEEVVVYDTQVVTGFGEHFSDVLGLTGDEATYGDKQRQLIRWVTIFSPAGSDIAMNILGRRRSLKSSEKRDSGSLGEVFVATIGPTTAAHLRDVLGVEPDVIAAKPSPEGLLEGMEQFLNKVGLEMPK